MAEPFKASVQYGDLKGYVAFDGHDGPPLRELAERTNMPGGYFPVGIELFRLLPDDKGMIRFRIVAVDTEQTGVTMDEIIKFAKSHDELPVYPFDGQMEAEEFAAHFKRFNLTAVDKSLKHFNIVAYNAP